MKNAQGKYILGHGPFEEVAELSGEPTAFYVNDFTLSSPHPWKIPSSVETIELSGSSQPGLEVEWKRPQLEGFAEVFSEVSEAIRAGEIQKSVPVVTELGEVREGSPEELIFSAKPDPELHAYAWRSGDTGFCGLTPEVLFSYEKGRLRTMALAGTASLEERDVFAADEKEILEHEFVAQTLIEKLNTIGMVQPELRRILQLRSLVHFYTPIYVGLYDAVSLNDLINLLHPTPALGPLPRTASSRTQLDTWRARLGCPSFFGAPMGIYDKGEFHSVVCIRGVEWKGKELSLPAGCGVIEPSRLTNEWRELELKRESVKTLFTF